MPPVAEVPRAARGSWPDRRVDARQAHGLIFAALVAASLLAVDIAGAPSLSAQVVVLALGTALLGLPHGALDHRVAAAAFQPRWGGRWPLPFLLVYAGGIALVLGGWAVAPSVTLLAFLLLSVMHFGMGDAIGSGPARVAEGLARGIAPIAVPAWTHPAEVATLFSWITGEPRAAAAITELLGGPLLFAGALAATVMALLMPRRLLPWLAIELAAVVTAFLVLPTLVAFTLYFCGLHSPRALLSIASERGVAPGASALAPLWREAAPLSLVASALVFVAFLAAPASGSLSAEAVRTLFQWLAALTVPHMTLGALAALTSRSARPFPVQPGTDARSGPAQLAAGGTGILGVP